MTSMRIGVLSLCEVWPFALQRASPYLCKLKAHFPAIRTHESGLSLAKRGACLARCVSSFVTDGERQSDQKKEARPAFHAND